MPVKQKLYQVILATPKNYRKSCWPN